MQVSVETLAGLERKLTIAIPAADIDTAVKARLKQVAKTARVDGFRQGKVPVTEVKRRYGAGVRQEIVGEQMQQFFVKAITEEKLNPAGMPTVTPTVDQEGKDFEFTATFEVYPEVKVENLDKIEIKKPTADIAEADVENMVEMLQKQQASFEVVEAESKDGDKIKIDFEGFVDGEAFEGGKAEGFDLELGKGQMIPGFEDQIVGMKAGEERTIKVTFPEDYQAENLKGKDAEFKIKAHEVQEAKLPELNEEFFKKFNVETSDLVEFKTEISKNMERELKQASKAVVKRQALDGLVEQNKIDVPAALVDQEIGRQQQQAVQQFGGGQQLDPSMLPKELFKDQSERRVTLGLLINAVIEANEIKVDDAKVEEMITDMASTYQDPAEVIEFYKNNPQQKQQVEALALEEQVVDFIVGAAKVEDEASNYEDVVKMANQQPQA